MKVVIGIGNPLRGDDAAGLAVADALAGGHRGLRVLSTQQLLPELAATIARARVVLFTDAAVGGEPGRVHCDRIVATRDAAPSPLHHAMSPGALLALAGDAYGCEPEAWLLRIVGDTFEMGRPLSPAVQRAVPEAARLATRKLRAARLLGWPLSP